MWQVTLKVQSQDTATDERAKTLRGLQTNYHVALFRDLNLIVVTAQVRASDSGTALVIVGDRVREALGVENAGIVYARARSISS